MPSQKHPTSSTLLKSPKIKATDEEKNLLLSLHHDFASLPDKKKFLAVIWPTLKKLFGCKDVFICILKNDTLSPILRVGDENRKPHAGYTNLIKADLPINDGFIDSILQSKTSCIYDLEKVSRWINPPPYIKTVKEIGFKSSISRTLTYGNDQLGVLTFWSERKDAFNHHHVELMEIISSQISIVFANILASESIRQRQQENEDLLLISNEIAAIRHKDDLSRILATTLKSHIHFDDAVITIYNKDKHAYNVYVYDIAAKRRAHPEISTALSADYPLHDSDLSNPHTPKVQDVVTLEASGHKAVAFIASSGIKEIATIKLVDGDELIGLFALLSERANTFTGSSLYLMQRISFQVSIAVAKLTALEKLQNREKEKEILLTIGRELASIRDKEDLLPLLKIQFERLNFYNDITIAKVDHNKKTFSAFLINEESDRLEHPEYSKMRSAHHEFPDGVFELALHAKAPVIFDLEEIVKRPNAPSYIKFLYENGTVEMAAVSLRDRNVEIAALFCFSAQKRSFTKLQLSIVQGIGDQLGTAVANILAHEEIRTRENEKTILLSLSREIAAVRNKSDLFKVISAKVNELFSIERFAIALINEDETTHSAFLIETEEHTRAHPDFKAVASGKYPIGDGIFNVVLQASDPVTFIVRDLTEPLPDYAKFWKKAGIESITGTALRVGQASLGAFYFRLDQSLYNQVSYNLLKGVCAQISIAISNIQANERIQRQLEEISMYKEQLEKEKLYLQEEASSGYTYNDIIGKSAAMQTVFHLLSQVSFTNSTVLLLGETGTGKELIARAIHNSSSRKNKLMVKVNCASIPSNLIESELFGHEKGSFTGAVERRVGKFELANKGTLFLDEIGELPIDLQSKLLRVLQEKEIERVGGKGVIKIDVRIIAATNRNLHKEVSDGNFRSDLYYRLNVFPITIPPLRERKEDIPILASHFITKVAKNIGKNISTISSKALKVLQGYRWPGNVRELEHLIERSVLLTRGNTIKEIHLPTSERRPVETQHDDPVKTLDENERDHILKALQYCKGKIFGKRGAAELLDINVSTLNSRIKKLGIKKNHPSFRKEKD